MSETLIFAFVLFFVAVLIWAIHSLGWVVGVGVFLLSFPFTYLLMWCLEFLDRNIRRLA